ncbi:MAG: hypothetical protein SFU55_04450 [Methylophilus sp.]|nr:hypothetical protein [Methylophilus sp.]
MNKLYKTACATVCVLLSVAALNLDTGIRADQAMLKVERITTAG